MQSALTENDPLESVPDPETVRVMLAETIRRKELLRSLHRLAVQKSKYPKPQRRESIVNDETPAGQGVARG